jgi:TPR repeat protein
MQLIARMAAVVVMATLAACGNAQDASLIPSLERLAHLGNPEALYHLGMAYHTGSGVKEDHAKALDAFRKAAALGDPLASYKLGCYYAGQGAGLIAPDTAAALKYKLVAAKAGYALAQQDVGVLYAQSGNIPVGLDWLEKSAAQGWSGGLMTLASVYNGAAGVKPDAGKTAAYFQLFLARSEPSDEQTAWLKNFEERLSRDDKKRADDIVRSYDPAPTQLTLKALSGQRAAQALIGQKATN